MTIKSVSKQYDRLTSEERFCLIMAANGRGDDAERDRLAGSADKVTFTTGDHVPFFDVFKELARLYFVELLDGAARYLEQLYLAQHFMDLEAREAGSESKRIDPDNPPRGFQYYLTALGTGFALKTKADGWKLFCERLSIPPFVLWEELPGFERLQTALRLAERATFTPEDYLRWRNHHVRQEGEPELTALPLTVEGIADDTLAAFRKAVRNCGG